MQWVLHNNPVRDGSDIYLCYMEMGKARVLRHNKPCFGGKYMLISYIPNVEQKPHLDSYYRIHEIAKYLGMSEDELRNIMVEQFNTTIKTVHNYYPPERPTAEELHFNTVEDITAAAEWLLSISLIKIMEG